MSVTAIDWQAGRDSLDALHGHADLGSVSDAGTRRALIEGLWDVARYRSHIHMARHGLGRGEYKYFDYSLLTGAACMPSRPVSKGKPHATELSDTMKPIITIVTTRDSSQEAPLRPYRPVSFHTVEGSLRQSHYINGANLSVSERAPSEYQALSQLPARPVADT